MVRGVKDAVNNRSIPVRLKVVVYERCDGARVVEDTANRKSVSVWVRGTSGTRGIVSDRGGRVPLTTTVLRCERIISFPFSEAGATGVTHPTLWLHLDYRYAGRINWRDKVVPIRKDLIGRLGEAGRAERQHRAPSRPMY